MQGAERVALILLCAGSSERMRLNKLMLDISGKTPMERCLDAFMACGRRPSSIIMAVSELTRTEAERLAAPLGEAGVCVKLVEGGATRMLSVYNALRAADADIAVIHDGARCLVTPELIDASIESAIAHGSGIVGVRSRDTVRMEGAGVLDRNRVFLAQTPQTFRYELIRRAYDEAVREGAEATDDCALYERLGLEPAFVEGGIMNQKLTFREDIPFFSAAVETRRQRVGFGEDTHRLTPGRRLVLGGVELEHDKGLLGHSDADVLVHAVMDSLLGAAALPDIGRLFPDTDPAYEGISSLLLLEKVGALLADSGFSVNNIDAVVIAEAPRLAPHIDVMRENLAQAMGVDAARVGIKATTSEGLGPEGCGECITARCICSILGA